MSERFFESTLTNGVLGLEALVCDTGVGAEPEVHHRACGMLGRWLRVSAKPGYGVCIGASAVTDLQIVIPTPVREDTGVRCVEVGLSPNWYQIRNIGSNISLFFTTAISVSFSLVL